MLYEMSGMFKDVGSQKTSGCFVCMSFRTSPFCVLFINFVIDFPGGKDMAAVQLSKSFYASGHQETKR